MQGIYNTPTDSISQKKFDRVNDQHVRRYVKMANRVAKLEKQLRLMVSIESMYKGEEE